MPGTFRASSAEHWRVWCRAWGAIYQLLLALVLGRAGGVVHPCSESISDDGIAMILPLLNAMCS